MTVAQLIGILNTQNHDALVFLASDPEGNSFHQLADYSPEIMEENELRDPHEEGFHVVVLWP